VRRSPAGFGRVRSPLCRALPALCTQVFVRAVLCGQRKRERRELGGGEEGWLTSGATMKFTSAKSCGARARGRSAPPRPQRTTFPTPPIYSRSKFPATPVYSRSKFPATPVCSRSKFPATPMYSRSKFPATPMWSRTTFPSLPIYIEPRRLLKRSSFRGGEGAARLSVHVQLLHRKARVRARERPAHRAPRVEATAIRSILQNSLGQGKEPPTDRRSASRAGTDRTRPPLPPRY